MSESEALQAAALGLAAGVVLVFVGFGIAWVVEMRKRHRDGREVERFAKERRWPT